MRLRFTVVVFAVLMFAAARPAGAQTAARMSVLALPGLAVAADPTGTMTLRDAQAGRIPFVPYAAFRYPGRATSLRPLVVWFKIPAPATAAAGPWYLEGGRYLGTAELYAPAGSGYRSAGFGMRVPYDRRAVRRAWPTVAIGDVLPRGTLYVRAAVDLEWFPMTIANAAALADEDASAMRNQRIVFLISGLFLALGLGNLLVFASIRETPYALYSLSMFILAALGPMQSNALAWEIFWPFASVSDMWTRYPALFLEGYISFVFAYLFLRPWEYAPRLNRAVRIVLPLLPLFDMTCVYAIPSVPIGRDGIGADLQALAMTAMFCFAAALGIAAARAGRKSGYFVLTGYGVVAVTYGAYAYSTVYANATALAWTYLLQLGGRAFEGFVLFWALVDRLNDTMQARLLAEQRASTDALTGLANRRAFDAAIEREWKRAQRAGAWIALGMIDIDHFKRYNDEHGHRAGDDCLRRVAQAIGSEAMRPDDLAARYGGEEFVVILPATDPPGAEQIFARLCDRIRRTQDVTVSIGIAVCPGGALSVDELVEHADRALYRAKAQGRDRVVSAAAVAESA